LPYTDVDRIAKMVPTTLNIKLDHAIKESAQIAEAYDKDPQGAIAEHRPEMEGWSATRACTRRV